MLYHHLTNSLTCLLSVFPLAQHVKHTVKHSRDSEFKWVSSLSAQMSELISVPTSLQRLQPWLSSFCFNTMPGKTDLSPLTN